MSWKGWDANTINLQEERIEELEQINAEMLKALEAWVEWDGEIRNVPSPPMLARAAIAKAKGE